MDVDSSVRSAARTERRRVNRFVGNILLIEDQVFLAKALSTMLHDRLGCMVETVSTMQEARAVLIARRAEFFLAVSDLHLPDAPNGEIIDLLNLYQVPVIAVTGAFGEELRELITKKEVIDYVLKDSALDFQYICDLILRISKNEQLKVMVVDDSPSMRSFMGRMLELQQLQVFLAKDGVEALMYLRMHPDIRLILVDHEMPNMDGFTFVGEARKLAGKDKLAIIGVSGSEESRLAAKFLKVGASDFISKPFSSETLICRVSQNLEMLEAIEMARNLAYRDYLSGLYNRRYFFEEGEKLHKNALAKVTRLTVMMLDIDHFKRVNDTYGHDVGDAVIVRLSSLLEEYFDGDLIARIGGEEFAVITQSQDAVGTMRKIEKFRQVVASDRLLLDDVEIACTVSIGVVLSLGADLDVTLKLADKNLYQAKTAGRNQVVFA